MLSNPAKARASSSFLAALLACFVLLAGCTTSPTSGRTQFNILPAPLEAGVSDLRFGVKTMLATGDYCRDTEGPCPIRMEAEKLAQRISPIAERLGTVAPQLSPELITRVPRIEVFVVPSDSASVSSSAGGKIAVNSGLGTLGLSDTDVALALSREFGRLASAHHRESTSAGLAVSLVAGSPLVGAYLATSILADLLFPMGSLIKLGVSLLGSIGTEQLVEASQQDEADAFAGKLMLAAGYDLRELAEARPDTTAGTFRLGWLSGYFVSRSKVAGMAPSPETTAKASTDQASPPEAQSEMLSPPTEMAADAAVDQASLPEAKPGLVGPLPDMTANTVTSQETPLDAKAEVAAPPPPESTAMVATDQASLPEARAELLTPPAAVAAKVVTDRAPPLTANTETAVPLAEMTALAASSQTRAQGSKLEAVETARQPDEALKPDSPPKAKPAAVKKKSPKFTGKKVKKTRKPPPKKKTSRAPSFSD